MSKKRDDGKLDRKSYEKQLRKLQEELCHLQDWVKRTGERIIVVLEGRDAAGKGGTIKAIRTLTGHPQRDLRILGTAAQGERLPYPIRDHRLSRRHVR